MNMRLSVKWALFGSAAVAGATALSGCELIVSFDRSKIPQDGSFPDVTTFEAGPDGAGPTDGTGPMETGSPDAASAEAGDGALPEAAVEGGEAGPVDAGVDIGPVVDATPEAAREAGPEAGGPDAPVDTGSTVDTGGVDAPDETSDGPDDAAATTDGDDSG